ncbi:hypothetical protein EDC94DRAFT_591054 [Helicostylum pulchrum]|nr:hypothetical protein EDC94DRAFT_591054 [Helicostylum pulchrum]
MCKSIQVKLFPSLKYSPENCTYLVLSISCKKTRLPFGLFPILFEAPHSRTCFIPYVSGGSMKKVKSKKVLDQNTSEYKKDKYQFLEQKAIALSDSISKSDLNVSEAEKMPIAYYVEVSRFILVYFKGVQKTF